MIKLSQQGLASLAPAIARPAYDRSRLTPGIVHIGCGNFHRAHQAWYMEQLFRLGLSTDWGIIGAGVRPKDAEMRVKLAAQDWLTTLIELSPEGKRAEVIGSMIGFAPVEVGNGALIASMSDPRIRIVSLTVTEGGYFKDQATGGFDMEHEDIRHDAEHPSTPRTAFGAMIEALRRRRASGAGPFTGLSCDNLQGNGDALKRAVLSLARLSDPELAVWIETHCTFPNSMVDCIVPNTGPRELELVRSFGIDDAAPVTHEPFRMWVIEDRFCAGRPRWERVGATFTDDVHGFERAKIRILNGGGQILGAAGELLGVVYVAEAMSDQRINRYFRRCEERDVLPMVADVPGYSARAYLDMVEARFSNAAMGDTLRRFAHDGSSRMPGFLLPSVQEGLLLGTPVDGLALASALWCRYCLGAREDGSTIEPNDPLWDRLRPVADDAARDPAAWLGMRDIYGDLGRADRFASSFIHWRRMIGERGVAASLNAYSNGTVG